MVQDVGSGVCLKSYKGSGVILGSTGKVVKKGHIRLGVSKHPLDQKGEMFQDEK